MALLPVPAQLALSPSAPGSLKSGQAIKGINTCKDDGQSCHFSDSTGSSFLLEIYVFIHLPSTRGKGAARLGTRGDPLSPALPFPCPGLQGAQAYPLKAHSPQQRSFPTSFHPAPEVQPPDFTDEETKA